MRRIIRSDIWQGETISTKARILRPNDAALISASATSLFVYNLTDGGTSSPQDAVFSLNITPTSTVVHTSYQTSGWTQDSTGYNFSHDQSFDDLSVNGGTRLRLEYAIETADGPVYLVHDVEVRPMLHL